MRRPALIALCGLLVISLMALAIPARATNPAPGAGTCIHVASGDWDYLWGAASGSNALGEETSGAWNPNPRTTFLTVSYQLPVVGATVTGISVDWRFDSVGGNGYLPNIEAFVFDEQNTVLDFSASYGALEAYTTNRTYHNTGFTGSAIGSTQTWDYPPNQLGQTIWIQLSNGSDGDYPGDPQIVGDVIVCYTGGATPTPSGTTTPSPTPTGTPFIPTPDGGFTVGGGCKILGLNNSTFVNPGNTWQLTGSGASMPGAGLHLSDGSATLSLNLDPDVQYRITLHYHPTDTVSGGPTFSAKLGSSPAVDVPISDLPASYSIAPQNFQSDAPPSRIYSFVLSKSVSSPDPGLVIDFACITAMTDGSGVVTDSVVIQPECKDCVYRPVGDLIQDIPKVVDWIVCFLSQLWLCTARVLFLGIWQAIVNILGIFAMVRLYAGSIAELAGIWVNANLTVLWNWLRGSVGNILIGLLNIITGIRNSGLGGIPGSIGEFVTNALAFLAMIGEIISTVIAIVFTAVVNTFNAVLGVFGWIPIIIQSIVIGFNSTETIPAYAPACNSSSQLLYYPCLGMYIADNTVFQGPFYYVMLLAMGFVAVNVLVWSIQTIREGITQ